MTYRVVLTREARKAYERAQPDLRRRLDSALDGLRENPFGPVARRLRGSLEGRPRYRVVVVVTVFVIAHRREVYD